jgi:hypothetical protein
MHPRYGLLLLTLILAVWFAFTACDGDEDTPAPTGGETPQANEQGQAEGPVPREELEEVGGDPPQEGEIDPCSLATKAEVEDILDEPVADTYRHTSPTVLCEWFSDEAASFGSVTIRLETGVSEDGLEDEIGFAEQLGGSKAEVVPDIGDSAYSVGPLLYAYAGDTLLIIAVIAHSNPELEGAKELAPRALARLP